MSKVAIVTGAGQGIGFAIAKRLVEDGFKVGVLDYNAETAEKAVAELSADKAFAVVADVSKQAEVAAAFQKVVEIFRHLQWSLNHQFYEYQIVLIWVPMLCQSQTFLQWTWAKASSVNRVFVGR